MLEPVEVPFRALAEAFVPEVVQEDETGWRSLTATVEAALQRQPEAILRQIVLLVRLLDWLPVARHGRRLRSLDPATRTRLLLRLQDSRLAVLRRGVWGLRTLVFMGYYTRADTYAQIGYAARPGGWDAIRAAATPEAPQVDASESPGGSWTPETPA
jgi:hypothetical protein